MVALCRVGNTVVDDWNCVVKGYFDEGPVLEVGEGFTVVEVGVDGEGVVGEGVVGGAGQSSPGSSEAKLYRSRRVC